MRRHSLPFHILMYLQLPSPLPLRARLPLHRQINTYTINTIDRAPSPTPLFQPSKLNTLTIISINIINIINSNLALLCPAHHLHHAPQP